MIRRQAKPNRSAGRTGFTWLAVALLVGAILVAGYVLWSRPVDVPPIPTVKLDDVDPAIADAVRRVRQSVVESPQQPVAWGEYGQMLYAHEFLDAAVECFATAARLDPNEPRWPYLHGMILAESDVAQGVPLIRRALSCRPDNLDLKLRLAELLFDLRQLPESESLFREVLQRENGLPRAKLGLARLLALSKQWEEGLRWARGAARGLPNLPAAHALLAKIYQRLDRREEAEQQLSLLRQLPPGNPQWPDPFLAEVVVLRTDASWLAETAHQYLAAGQPEPYVQALQRLVADHPERVSYPIALAKVLMDMGELTMARAVVRDGLRRHPRSVELLFLEGSLDREEGDLKAAIVAFREVVQLKSDYAEAWNALATTLAAREEFPAAANAFAQVLRYDSTHPEVYLAYAEVLLRLDQTDRARRQLEQALALAPNDPQIRKMLGRLDR